jgi:hypothetical protein
MADRELCQNPECSQRFDPVEAENHGGRRLAIVPGLQPLSHELGRMEKRAHKAS